MKLLIALYHPFSLWTAPAWFDERLRQDFPDLTIVRLPGAKYEGFERELDDADVLLGWSLKPEQFAHAKKLRWIHSPAAAVHQLMYPEMAAGPVVITNARAVHAPVVAEHILALLLALAKRLPSAMRYQREKVWAQEAMWNESPTLREAAGSVVCVVGMGSIGTEFSRRAQALEMHVVAVREHPGRGAGFAQEVVGARELETVLPRADFVVLCAPVTTATRGLMNAARIACMKKDAYLINVGRGTLIDDAALIAALRDRRIAGAALDVFVEEPLPPDSPYWTLDNVLITPHTAALTDKLWERHYRLVSENLRRFLARQPLLYVVNKQKGY
ncbi:MAG: D-2-hydroxyacid dehydrogenase [Acidobacteriales bacterium]|nr:D-2-hydroxyacid dehydrogenase [Terriglobales bacterium]